jgi:hypothetical protein
MNNQALYWIALGVLALGMNSEYQKGNLPLAHRVADRAGVVLCHVTAKAEQVLALARVLTRGQEFSVDDQFLAHQQAEVDRVLAEHQADLDRVMAVREVNLDRVQRKLDRMHIMLDRVQVEKVRKLERVRFKLANANSRRMVVVCPETGDPITIESDSDAPDLSDLDADSK